MNIYELWNDDGIKEIKADCHIEPSMFKVIAEDSFDVVVDSASIKLVYETMRVHKNQRTYIRCDKHTFGAKPVTIGVVK